MNLRSIGHAGITVALALSALPLAAAQTAQQSSCPSEPMEFMLFFDHEGTDLTGPNRELVDFALSLTSNGACPIVAVSVVGSSESETGLGARRVNAVRDAFLAAGVPANRIETEYGIEAFRPGTYATEGVLEPAFRRVGMEVTYGRRP